MADIRLVDVSFRDGNQSLWSATGLKTRMVLEIAPVVDRVGFLALDFGSSTQMGVAVRTHREDPWALLRLAHAAMPGTPLQFIGTGFRFISWETAHPELMQLVYERLVANGMSRFVALDPMNDADALVASAAVMRAAGAAEVIGALVYTVSPVHDDAHYAALASRIAACPDVDRAYLKDPAGLLTPDRARTLIPVIRAALGGKPLELHSHCTIGLAPLTYMTAADLGIDALHVASGPLGSGSSLPVARRVVANLREHGHEVDVDDRALGLVDDYFTRLAEAEGLPAGAPRDYDASFLRHQVAGGVMTTTRRQLAEIGLEDRFDAVVEEVDRVRAELGYPIMVTPFPQIVCGQALANVIGTERYASVADQVIRYVQGSFGRPTAPVDADVRDRILSSARAAELAAEPPPLPPEELRRRFAPGISDEELLLRATMPAEQVDAMLAAGPAGRHYNPEAVPVLEVLRSLRGRTDADELVVDRPGFRLELRRRGKAGGR